MTRQLLAIGWAAALVVGCATSGHQLAFDVHPCAGEVHLALKDVQVVDATGHAMPGAKLAGNPQILLRDGDAETELGTFEPGCGGGLRLHVPLPATTTETPTILLRGRLTDGTPVTGCQPITASDYR
jgi:hypothetical protein